MTNVSEVYNIPTNCEKGYLPEILIMIGNYTVEINKQIEKYRKIIQLYLHNAFKEIIKMESISKDENFLFQYPSFIDIIINCYGQHDDNINNRIKYRISLVYALVDLIISQFQEQPEWKIIHKLSIPEIYYGVPITVNIECELKDFLIYQYYESGKPTYWEYILCSQYDISYNTLDQVITYIRWNPAPKSELIAHLQKIFYK